MKQAATWHLVVVGTLATAWFVCFFFHGIFGMLASHNTWPGKRSFRALHGSIFGMWPKDDFTEIGLQYRATSLRFAVALVVILGLLAIMIGYLSISGVV